MNLGKLGPPLTDREVEDAIRKAESPNRVYHDGKPAIDWMGMRNRSCDDFRAYIDLRDEARRRGLTFLLSH